MLAALMLLAAASGPAGSCAHRPAAPDVQAARRIAEVVFRNRGRTGGPLGPYRLSVDPIPGDPDHWVARHSPARRGVRGGAMRFRINRCSGAVSEVAYER